LRKKCLVIRKTGIVALFGVVGSVLLHDGFGNLPGRKAPAPMFFEKSNDLLGLRKRHGHPLFS